MTEPRRPRTSTLDKRRRILDAVERIMLSDGYAAVTSRRVQAEAGVKPHYHFGSVDDLFVAMVRRRGEISVAMLSDALASEEPLRAWWQLASDRRGNALLVELTAAANHRPVLRAEVASFAREVRRMQIEALDAVLDDYGIDRGRFPPALIAAAVQGLAYASAYDLVAGFDTSQDEAAAAMAALLDDLEAVRATRRG